MRTGYALALSLLLPLVLGGAHAYAEEPASMEQLTSDGSVKVRLVWPEVLPDQLYNIELFFLDPESGEPVAGTVLYDVEVTQQGHPIERYLDQRTDTGSSSFEVVFPADGTGSAEVAVAIIGMGSDPTPGETHETAVFNVQVVPEFPLLLTLVMAASFGIIMVITRLKGQTRIIHPA